MIEYRILHIVTDEKFIDGVIELFDSIIEYKSEYVILNETIKEYKYIKSPKINPVSDIWFENHCIYSKDYDIIIIHGLMGNNPCNIYRIDCRIKVIWFSWGYDLYEMPLPIKPIISLRNQIRGFRKIKEHIINAFKISSRFIREAIIYRLHNNRNWIKAIERIDYYSGVFPEEYEILKKKHFFRAKKIQFNYISKASPIKNDNKYTITNSTRKNIMVGHQANLLLNHIQCFESLKKLKIPIDINIICPLSYGSKNEIKKIYKKGNRIFGNQFKALLDFLPYNDYLKLYSSINIAIYDIQRQCAVGNILLSIWDGVKVFLPKNSMNYIHFINLGLKVYSIEDELNIYNITTSAPQTEIMSNRKILLEQYSYEIIRERLKTSLSIIKKSIESSNY